MLRGIISEIVKHLFHVLQDISIFIVIFTLYFIETHLKAFANRADPDQAALERAA